VCRPIFGGGASPALPITTLAAGASRGITENKTVGRGTRFLAISSDHSAAQTSAAKTAAQRAAAAAKTHRRTGVHHPAGVADQKLRDRGARQPPAATGKGKGQGTLAQTPAELCVHCALVTSTPLRSFSTFAAPARGDLHAPRAWPKQLRTSGRHDIARTVKMATLRAQGRAFCRFPNISCRFQEGGVQRCHKRAKKTMRYKAHCRLDRHEVVGNRRAMIVAPSGQGTRPVPYYAGGRSHLRTPPSWNPATAGGHHRGLALPDGR